MKIKRALISVSDKEGIVVLAKGLEALGVEILSTGGTAKKLKEEGVKITEVSDYTGHPEILDGRVKTMHPKITGGILAVRGNKKHQSELKKHKIEPIDLVVVNLYPFQETILKDKVKFEDAIEDIDIGGPSLIRSAAKNHKDVGVVVDTRDYEDVLVELNNNDASLSKETRERLAVKAFHLTASYDALISNWMHLTLKQPDFPERYTKYYEKREDLRYGENPHQQAALYIDPLQKNASLIQAEQLHGKHLSFNNYLDMNEGIELIKEFDEPTAAILKHTNPCGIASDATIEEAYSKASDVDPQSAFGSVVMMNKKCTKGVAEAMKGKFVEIVLAPGFEKEALDILTKKKNVRLMDIGDTLQREPTGYRLRYVSGGVLVETSNVAAPSEKTMKIATKRKPTKKEMEDLLFAWKVNKHVKSNSVVLIKDKVAYGIGAGQMSRVDSSIIAVRKSSGRAKGGVMSSDAFFPFRDGIDEAAKAGIRAIIQPGGSIRDQEVIDACNEHDIAMVFTGIRLFKH